MAETAQKPARERILETATDLFYREGIRSVGVDTIIARSGVAKMSLYRNFPSKDDLVCAWLEDTRRRFWGWWDGIMARAPGDPRAQVAALFTALGKWRAHPAFRGCPFLNTLTEYRDTGHPGRAIAEAHQRAVRGRFAELAAMAGAREPDLLADQLMILLHGAYASGPCASAEVSVRTLVSAADALLDAACSPAR
ncbi:TetR/AcrR family transcriptional regulator [Azospirillum sp.]|uniref:TetR/AcrR family transcriptional regulator n=1 Tax=Azospirillum sp. TaxID=34012 RepID=UPI002D288F9F|nr:TetR/AcrR family transcriptional regulator [Azospirillum sp.]HYD70350.1 TetR/AcrR family transcriptional regulator [Azospirillum sp.]